MDDICRGELGLVCDRAVAGVHRETQENVGRFSFKLNRRLVKRCGGELLKRRKRKKLFGKEQNSVVHVSCGKINGVLVW